MPKYHHELSHEGIDNIKGCSKRRYRAWHLLLKRSVGKLIKPVKECIENVKVTTYIKFSGIGRPYILDYHYYDLNGDQIAPGYDKTKS